VSTSFGRVRVLGRRLIVPASCVAFWMVLGVTAKAAIITAGGSYSFNPPTDAISLPSGAPDVSETMGFTGTDASSQVVFTGTIYSAVYEHDASNTLGGYDFVYQINNDSGSADPIDEFSVTSFLGFGTDVNYALGNVNPTSADRTLNGATIDYYFTSAELYPGDISDYLIVKTDATSIVQGAGSVIDGGTGGAEVEVPTFGSRTMVPEPGSAALIVLAGGLVLGRRNRRIS
jgi:hypothetical protein